MKSCAVIMAVAAALVAGCNQSVKTASEKFNELPPAVQKTVRAQAPNAEVTDVSQKTQDGREVYEVDFRGEGHNNPKVVVAEDGTLVSSDIAKPAGPIERMLTPTGATGTPLSALPEAAQKTIQAQAPGAPIASITRHESNGRVIYKVEFQEPGKNPTIEVAEDGTLVQTLQK